jgi:hypothetical protein
MPIRLNLLAEAQVEEELRRRDPVKRATWMGALLVLAVLVWSSSLKVENMMSNVELKRLEEQLSSHTNEYRQVLENQKKFNEVSGKLGALHQLATNRFLNGNLLNALQQATMDNVQLIKFRCEQLYSLTEETKARTNGDAVMPGKAATVSEKITLFLDAKDSSAKPGDSRDLFKDRLSGTPYFQKYTGKSSQFLLLNLGMPQTSPEGKSFVVFNLQFVYPEKTR